jgi:hypothetical protein
VIDQTESTGNKIVTFPRSPWFPRFNIRHSSFVISQFVGYHLPWLINKICNMSWSFDWVCPSNFVIWWDDWLIWHQSILQPRTSCSPKIISWFGLLQSFQSYVTLRCVCDLR